MTAPALDYTRMSDADLAARACARDPHAVRLITSENNQRLYRAAWSVLRDRAEAEEVVQEAYLKAFTGRTQFSGASSLSTWLTRIVINEALERKRAAQSMKRNFDLALLAEYRDRFAGGDALSPEDAVLRVQVSRILEQIIAALPDDFRSIFILRDIEDMSVEETSEALGVAVETVKTRLFRARRRLRQSLGPDLREVLRESFLFAGADCARLTMRTLVALSATGETDHE